MFGIIIFGIIFSVGLIAIIFTGLFVILTKRKKELNTKFVMILSSILVIVSFWLSYKMFTEMIWYNYDSKYTASKGLLFKDTLMLSEHKLIGSSDYIIFKMDMYSRSDRQLEVINVIQNENKTKDIKWKS